MDPEYETELRMRCLELACRSNLDDAVEVAENFVAFAKNEKRDEAL